MLSWKKKKQIKKLAADSYLADFLFRVVVCPCSHYSVLITKPGTTPHCITLNSLYLELMGFLPLLISSVWAAVYWKAHDGPWVFNRPGRAVFLANEMLMGSIISGINQGGDWMLCRCWISQNIWRCKLNLYSTSILHPAEEENHWS